jgi:DNA-binding transcriptional MerR regulator
MDRADDALGDDAQRLAGGAHGLTITRAARVVGLSRTTLMYYERLGLIRPLRRAGSRYRTFGPDDLRTLFLIARWREIGLPLAAIERLLAHRDEASAVLQDHLVALDESIALLRHQRRMTLELLGIPGRGGLRATTPLTKAAWTEMFRAIGLSDVQMREWHRQFEQRSPKSHEQFLRSLGLDRTQVGRIRKASST